MVIDIAGGKLVGLQGPGSLYIDTDGSSYIISAADKWYDSELLNKYIDRSELEIKDVRLEKVLGVENFYQVPKYRVSNVESRKKNTTLQIPINRFPLAEYCSVCKTLSYRQGASLKGKKSECIICNRKTIHIQFPIVIVCEKGHISDFPFNRYAHIDTELSYDEYKKHIITIETHNSPSILNWTIRCKTCKATHSLAGVTGRGSETSSPFMQEMKGSKCFGKKPWTGDTLNDKCEEVPIAVLKNSLNVYRPEIIHTLSLTNNYENEYNIDYNGILEQEFNEITKGRQTNEDKLKVDLSFENDKSNTIIESVYFVHRLEEIIVQTNFHRVEPADDENTYNKATSLDSKESMLFSENVQGKWYPAKRMYGEGIFIKFRKNVVSEWSKRKEVIERFEKVKARTKDFYLTSRFETPASILIHTLSHALIRELGKHSGYGITSLNEKLYFEVDGNNNGLLIYVTDSDKAGTYGGLVRLAEKEKFIDIFNKAINNMEWCSSDPVCYEFGGESGQGIQNSNGSACHNCTYVPDISCGFRNCYLDRDFLSGYYSKLKIIDHYTWFDSEAGLNIIKNGESVKKIYNDWQDYAVIENNNYYSEKGWDLPDYYDGLIEINGQIYEAKHIWMNKRKIVLFRDQEKLEDIPSEINQWKLIIENKIGSDKNR